MNHFPSINFPSHTQYLPPFSLYTNNQEAHLPPINFSLNPQNLPPLHKSIPQIETSLETKIGADERPTKKIKSNNLLVEFHLDNELDNSLKIKELEQIHDKIIEQYKKNQISSDSAKDAVRKNIDQFREFEGYSDSSTKNSFYARAHYMYAYFLFTSAAYSTEKHHFTTTLEMSKGYAKLANDIEVLDNLVVLKGIQAFKDNKHLLASKFFLVDYINRKNTKGYVQNRYLDSSIEQLTTNQKDELFGYLQKTLINQINEGGLKEYCSIREVYEKFSLRCGKKYFKNLEMVDGYYHFTQSLATSIKEMRDGYLMRSYSFWSSFINYCEKPESAYDPLLKVISAQFILCITPKLFNDSKIIENNKKFFSYTYRSIIGNNNYSEYCDLAKEYNLLPCSENFAKEM